MLTKLELNRFVVSPDLIRCEIGGLHTNKKGIQTRGYVDESIVWNKVYCDVRSKMMAEELVIIDATFQQKRDYKQPLALAKTFDYSATVIDFTLVAEKTARDRNSQRTGWQHVPPTIISRAYSRFAKQKLPNSVERIAYSDFESSQIYLDICLHHKIEGSS